MVQTFYTAFAVLWQGVTYNNPTFFHVPSQNERYPLFHTYCFFSEILAFPAGGSAAIFFIGVVLILVVIKIFCMITGYETRVPSARIDTVIEEQKQILIQEESGDERGGSSVDGRSRQSHHECEHHPPPSPLGNKIY